MNIATKTLVQCDFDGTITREDVSLMILEAFADGNWRRRLKDYETGEISVGRFNTEAFAMVKANKGILLEAVRDRIKIRAGFSEMVDCCRRKGFRFVIVSNGLDFYIEEVMKNMGMGDIEVFAAKTHFHPEGLEVHYIGPDGSYLDSNFKGSYVNSFLGDGYRIIYVGNGSSDLAPAKECHHIFATGTLVTRCRQANLACTSFTDFREVTRVIEPWQ